jgi:hypothetical protein
MKTALKVFSIISLVLGGLAFFGGFVTIADGWVSDGMLEIFAGMYWIAFSIVVLVYISKK